MRIWHISPCVCMFCGHNACYDELPVCEDCAERLYRMLRDRCKSCGKCIFECDCPDVGGAKCLFFFGGIDARRVIYAVKNRPDDRVIEFFADMLIRAARINSKRFDAVTYVPRRKKAVNYYGFDQSKEIARTISRITGIPLVTVLCHKGNRQQKLLGMGDRKKNIKSSFGLKYIPKERYKKILIVDDVITTGATVKACAELLRENAANAVVPVAMAKTNFALRKKIDF